MIISLKNNFYEEKIQYMKQILIYYYVYFILVKFKLFHFKITIDTKVDSVLKLGEGKI